MIRLQIVHVEGFEKEHTRGDGTICEIKCPRAQAFGNPISLQRGEVPIGLLAAGLVCW